MAIIDDLRNYWKMDEASGNPVDTQSGITLTNNGSTPFTTGILNNAADLSGSGDYFSRAARTWGVANAWSWSLWFNADTFNNGRYIFFSTGNSGTNIYNNVTLILATGGNPSVELYPSGSSSPFKVFSVSAGLSLSTWYHLVLTWDGTDVKLYINGTSQTLSFSVDTAGTMTDSSRALFIGATHVGTAPHNGRLDEIGLWSRALTSGEVTSLYNGGTPLPYDDFDTPASTFRPRISVY